MSAEELLRRAIAEFTSGRIAQGLELVRQALAKLEKETLI